MKKICLSMMLISLLLAGCSSKGSGDVTAYVVEKKECYENGKLTSIYEYTYDDNGLPVSGTIKDQDGKENTKLEFEKNNDGKISKLTYSDVKYDEVSYLTYDDKGNNISYKRSDSEQKNKYNENNQCVKSQLYDKDNKLISETKYEYDKDGNRSLEDSYFLSQHQYKNENFTYDEHGNVTGYHSTDCMSGKEKDYKFEYNYDNNGCLIEYSYDGFDTNLKTIKCTHKYTYKAINVNNAEEKEYIEKFNIK